MPSQSIEDTVEEQDALKNKMLSQISNALYKIQPSVEVHRGSRFRSTPSVALLMHSNDGDAYNYGQGIKEQDASTIVSKENQCFQHCRRKANVAGCKKGQFIRNTNQKYGNRMQRMNFCKSFEFAAKVLIHTGD